MVMGVGIWEHLKPGQFSMIHGTKAEIAIGKLEGGKCDHAADKAAHLTHYKPDVPPHGVSILVVTLGTSRVYILAIGGP